MVVDEAKVEADCIRQICYWILTEYLDISIGPCMPHVIDLYYVVNLFVGFQQGQKLDGTHKGDKTQSYTDLDHRSSMIPYAMCGCSFFAPWLVVLVLVVVRPYVVYILIQGHLVYFTSCLP